MLNRWLSRRWRWILLATAGVGVIALAVAAFAVVWPYLKYPDAEHRQAARHLDKVSIEGYSYRGEDASEYGSVSRFWLKRGAFDRGVTPQYDHRPIQTETPGRDLSTSRYEQEIGWLLLRDDDPPCVLRAFRVLEVGPGIGLTFGAEDEKAIAEGRAAMIRVVVICGDG